MVSLSEDHALLVQRFKFLDLVQSVAAADVAQCVDAVGVDALAAVAGGGAPDGSYVKGVAPHVGALPRQVRAVLQRHRQVGVAAGGRGRAFGNAGDDPLPRVATLQKPKRRTASTAAPSRAANAGADIATHRRPQPQRTDDAAAPGHHHGHRHPKPHATTGTHLEHTHDDHGDGDDEKRGLAVQLLAAMINEQKQQAAAKAAEAQSSATASPAALAAAALAELRPEAPPAAREDIGVQPSPSFAAASAARDMASASVDATQPPLGSADAVVETDPQPPKATTATSPVTSPQQSPDVLTSGNDGRHKSANTVATDGVAVPTTTAGGGTLRAPSALVRRSASPDAAAARHHEFLDVGSVLTSLDGMLTQLDAMDSRGRGSDSGAAATSSPQRAPDVVPVTHHAAAAAPPAVAKKQQQPRPVRSRGRMPAAMIQSITRGNASVFAAREQNERFWNTSDTTAHALSGRFAALLLDDLIQDVTTEVCEALDTAVDDAVGYELDGEDVTPNSSTEA